MWGRKLGYTVNKIRSSDHLVRGSQERRQWLEEAGFRFAVRGGGIDQASNDEKWEHKVLPAITTYKYKQVHGDLHVPCGYVCGAVELGVGGRAVEHAGMR